MATSHSLQSIEKRTIVITDRDYERLVKLIRSGRTGIDASGTVIKLTGELRHALIVRSDEVSSNVVTMNSQIVLQDITTGRERTMTLVYPNDADINEMKISIFAPSAITLLGCRVGDVVSWPAPIGIVQFRIKQITYQPKAAQDFHL